MKNLKIIAMSLISCYLIIGFILYDLNAKNWSMNDRGSLIKFSFFFCICLFAIREIKKLD